MEFTRSIAHAVRIAHVVLAGASGLAGPRSKPVSQADVGIVESTMTCARAAAPGRVRCEVEARAKAGESIAWGDVTLIKTPSFASGLRGRVGPHETVARESGMWRWALALVARAPGSGDVEVHVRLVVCKDGVCAPRQTAVIGRVVVGPG